MKRTLKFLLTKNDPYKDPIKIPVKQLGLKKVIIVRKEKP